ncbi:hypothetical protein Tco_1125199 [Tanacetum coccineum]|uniref:Uncharacterized protein n=1 Tax=Tanacetum coccineum TaxID=301880 RepID=A0ABQ5J8D2_9ASTR
MSFCGNKILRTYTSRLRLTPEAHARAFWRADDEEIPEGGSTDTTPDEHEFPAEEQPLPPVDSPTAESPEYVTESDLEEDPEEYEDDETEDGPVNYPMDGGDDGDDDDGDSSGDDADGEDEDDEDEEEEHLALADSTIVVPVDEPVFPLEGTEPAIPPPSTNITIGARITVRPQTSISLLPEAEVERLLAMTTPSPSPPISLSPPCAGERLARCTAPPAHSSPPPVPSPLLPSFGCPTQIQILRIASTQALMNAILPHHHRNLHYHHYPPSLYNTTSLLTNSSNAKERRKGTRDLEPIVIMWDAQRPISRHTRHRYSYRVLSFRHSIRRQAQMVETLRVIRDMRRENSDMQAELFITARAAEETEQPGPDQATATGTYADHRILLGDSGLSHI